MIITIDTDNVVSLFDSVDKAEGSLEAIDIENNEYQVCDDVGVIYKLELLEPPGIMKEGSFRIIQTDEKNPDLPSEYFKSYGKSHCSLDEMRLDEILNSSSSIEEAFNKLGVKKTDW